MSAIIPPLDKIPKIPGYAVNITISQINRLIDKLIKQTLETAKKASALDISTKCDDKVIKDLKQELTDLQALIKKIQGFIKKIPPAVKSIKTIIKTVKAIKAANVLAMLSNPLTAPIFTSTELNKVLDASIVNALESLNQFASVPATALSKLTALLPELINIASSINSTCNGNGDTASVSVSPELLGTTLAGTVAGNATDGQIAVDDTNNNNYDDILPSDFYNEYNASDDDLNFRDDVIQTILDQQLDLLASIQEAPSIVIHGNGDPIDTIGKTGDYYVDKDTDTIYGPKPYRNSWI